MARSLQIDGEVLLESIGVPPLRASAVARGAHPAGQPRLFRYLPGSRSGTTISARSDCDVSRLIPEEGLFGCRVVKPVHPDRRKKRGRGRPSAVFGGLLPDPNIGIIAGRASQIARRTRKEAVRLPQSAHAPASRTGPLILFHLRSPGNIFLYCILSDFISMLCQVEISRGKSFRTIFL